MGQHYKHFNYTERLNLLVAKRASEPQRNGATLTPQPYQHQSGAPTQSLVWAGLLSTRGAAALWLSVTGPSQTETEAVVSQDQ